MKKLIMKGIVMTAFFSVVSISCKKNKEDSNSDFSLLTMAAWKVSKYEQKIDSDPYIDQFPGWAACTKDDIYLFKTNNIYEINEGTTTCNSGDPQVIFTGTWLFKANRKIDIGQDEYTIEQLDQNTLVISNVYISNPDTKYTRYTFVH
ncbi:MAG: hypothetical protein JJE22_05310 [Bacteroidia bacterium]|nr:hypothetical protein [Bacteroidia bacterium]